VEYAKRAKEQQQADIITTQNPESGMGRMAMLPTGEEAKQRDLARQAERIRKEHDEEKRREAERKLAAKQAQQRQKKKNTPERQKKKNTPERQKKKNTPESVSWLHDAVVRYLGETCDPGPVTRVVCCTNRQRKIKEHVCVGQRKEGAPAESQESCRYPTFVRPARGQR